jgi:hypothetical protein
MPRTLSPIASKTSPWVSVGEMKNFSQIKFDLGKLLIVMVVCRRFQWHQEPAKSRSSDERERFQSDWLSGEVLLRTISTSVEHLNSEPVAMDPWLKGSLVGTPEL